MAARTNRQWESAAPATWTSGGIAVATTSALFVTAFVAMTTARVQLETSHISRRAVLVQLILPSDFPMPAIPRPVPTQPRVLPAVPPPARAVTQRSDVSQPTKLEPMRDTAAAATEPPRTESAAAPATRAPSITQLLPMRDIPAFARGSDGGRAGAAVAPAGVTLHARTISTAKRDSIATDKVQAIPGTAAATGQTAEAKEQLRQQMEPGLPAYGRAARLPGYAASVPLMNGGYSVAITAVSTAGHLDRTARDALDADFQRRLRRLQDRALLRRDSITADSLRSDSLSKKP